MKCRRLGGAHTLAKEVESVHEEALHSGGTRAAASFADITHAVVGDTGSLDNPIAEIRWVDVAKRLGPGYLPDSIYKTWHRCFQAMLRKLKLEDNGEMGKFLLYMACKVLQEERQSIPTVDGIAWGKLCPYLSRSYCRESLGRFMSKETNDELWQSGYPDILFTTAEKLWGGEPKDFSSFRLLIQERVMKTLKDTAATSSRHISTPQKLTSPEPGGIPLIGSNSCASNESENGSISATVELIDQSQDALDLEVGLSSPEQAHSVDDLPRESLNDALSKDEPRRRRRNRRQRSEKISEVNFLQVMSAVAQTLVPKGVSEISFNRLHWPKVRVTLSKLFPDAKSGATDMIRRCWLREVCHAIETFLEDSGLRVDVDKFLIMQLRSHMEYNQIDKREPYLFQWGAICQWLPVIYCANSIIRITGHEGEVTLKHLQRTAASVGVLSDDSYNQFPRMFNERVVSWLQGFL